MILKCFKSRPLFFLILKKAIKILRDLYFLHILSSIVLLFWLSPVSTCIRLIVTSSWSSLCLFTATSSPIRSCSSLLAISASSSALKHVFKVHKYKAWHLIHVNVYRSFKAKYSWEHLLDICGSNCKAAVPFNGSGKKNSSYHTNINKYVLSMTKSKIK